MIPAEVAQYLDHQGTNQELERIRFFHWEGSHNTEEWDVSHISPNRWQSIHIPKDNRVHDAIQKCLEMDDRTGRRSSLGSLIVSPYWGVLLGLEGFITPYMLSRSHLHSQQVIILPGLALEAAVLRGQKARSPRLKLWVDTHAEYNIATGDSNGNVL